MEQRKIRLLVSNRCKFCDDAVSLLKEKIDKGMVEIVNIDKNKDGRELAKLFGGVPTCVEEYNGEIRELILLKNLK